MMRATGKATADSRSVQSFAIIKNTGNVFTLELEINYPSETSLCTVAPSPQTPLLRFFLTERGAANISDADSDEDDEGEDEDEDEDVAEKVVDPETLWTAVKTGHQR